MTITHLVIIIMQSLCNEVATSLKKMKIHKVPGLSGLVAEIIQARGNTGTQQILDLHNGIVKEGCIPEDWKLSMVLPIYKGKGDPMEYGSDSELTIEDERLTRAWAAKH